jgi:hypothetical protein
MSRLCSNPRLNAAEIREISHPNHALRSQSIERCKCQHIQNDRSVAHSVISADRQSMKMRPQNITSHMTVDSNAVSMQTDLYDSNTLHLARGDITCIQPSLLSFALPTRIPHIKIFSKMTSQHLIPYSLSFQETSPWTIRQNRYFPYFLIYF